MTRQTSDENNHNPPGPVADEGDVDESGWSNLLWGWWRNPWSDTDTGCCCLLLLGLVAAMPLSLCTATEAPIFGQVCCEADDSLWVKVLFGLVFIPLGLLAAAFVLGLLIDNAQKKRSTSVGVVGIAQRIKNAMLVAVVAFLAVGARTCGVMTSSTATPDAKAMAENILIAGVLIGAIIGLLANDGP